MSRVPAVATYLLEITAPAVYDVNGTLLKNGTLAGRMVEGEAGRRAAQLARTAWVPIERSGGPCSPGSSTRTASTSASAAASAAVGGPWVARKHACATLKPGASVVGSMKAPRAAPRWS